jgi:hypothetical protein
MEPRRSHQVPRAHPVRIQDRGDPSRNPQHPCWASPRLGRAAFSFHLFLFSRCRVLKCSDATRQVRKTPAGSREMPGAADTTSATAHRILATLGKIPSPLPVRCDSTCSLRPPPLTPCPRRSRSSSLLWLVVDCCTERQVDGRPLHAEDAGQAPLGDAIVVSGCREWTPKEALR